MSATLTELTINLDDMSFQDLIDIQRATGTKVTRDTLADPGIDVVAAMLWVTLRKEEPTLTFEQFCQQGIGVELAEAGAGAADPKAAAVANSSPAARDKAVTGPRGPRPSHAS